MADIEHNDQNSGIIADGNVKNSNNEDNDNTVTVTKTETENKTIEDSFNDKTVTVSGNTVDSNNTDVDVKKSEDNDNTVVVNKTETENKTITDSFNDKTVTVTNASDDDKTVTDSFNKKTITVTKNETENKTIDSFNKDVDIHTEDNDNTLNITKNDNDTKTVNVSKQDNDVKNITDSFNSSEDNDKTVVVTKTETDSHDKTATNSFNDNDTATDSYNKTVSVHKVEDSYNEKKIVEDSFNEKKIVKDSFNEKTIGSYNTTTNTDSHDSLLNLKDEVLKIEDDVDVESSVAAAKAVGQDVSGAGDDNAFSFEQINNLADQDKLWGAKVSFDSDVHNWAKDDFELEHDAIGGGFVQWASAKGAHDFGMSPANTEGGAGDLVGDALASADATINQSAFNQNIVMGANIQVNDLSISIGDDILPT
jgi:hypothetical protein